MRKSLWLQILFLAASLAGSSAAAAGVVIVNLKNSSGLEKLDRDKAKGIIKDIFLAKKREFPNGSQAQPVDQSEESPLREVFYQKVAGKDGNDMKLYWSNLIFTGDGTPPKSVATDEDVKKYVRENAGGIGYVESPDETVKVVYRLK